MLMLQVIVSPMNTRSDNLFSFLSAVMLTLFFIGAYACQARPKFYASGDAISWLVFGARCPVGSAPKTGVDSVKKGSFGGLFYEKYFLGVCPAEKQKVRDRFWGGTPFF